MNKKMFISIVALGAIVTGNANAAITKDQCMRSDKTVWVENVTNSDGSKGACAPKNTCTSKNFKTNFCVTDFKDIQLESTTDAHTVINTYVKTQLNWTAGCTEFLDFDVDNATGQDYIGCKSNGRYRTFEFDDTNEKYASTFVPDFRRALCIASGGQFINSEKCNNISQDLCSIINGNYDLSVPTCALNSVKQDVLDKYNAALDAADAISSYQMPNKY